VDSKLLRMKDERWGDVAAMVHKIRLRTGEHRSTGHVIHAPPVIELSSNTTHYLCGQCETLLLLADPGQVHGILIQCKECDCYNQADI
jgi:hypothetical protein